MSEHQNQSHDETNFFDDTLPETDRHEPKKPSAFKPLLIGLVFIAAFSMLVFFKSRPAPTPEVFATPVALIDAIERAGETEKLVFAVVTADWCPPCQSYKRNALADERVAQWLDQHAIAVMVDATREISRTDALLLNDPRSIPMTALFRGGEMIASFEGQMNATDLLAWLESKRTG